MKSLPELPLHGQYRVSRVPEGLCVTYPAGVLGAVLCLAWLMGFMLVVAVSATAAPSSLATLKTLLVGWAGSIPLVVIFFAANFRHPLTLRNDGQVARGEYVVPAGEVIRRGDWLNLGGRWIWLPILRKDLDWLQASLTVLRERRPDDLPLEVPERLTEDYSDGGSSGAFLWVSLVLLLAAAGWTGWTVLHEGTPALPYWSRLWTVGGGLATLLLLAGLLGRNTIALSTFLYAALLFAWNANFLADPSAATREFSVLARFETGRDDPRFETRFLELDVPEDLAAFRFVAYRGEIKLGDKVAFRLGQGAVGQAWLKGPKDWHDPMIHFSRPEQLPADNMSWHECVKSGVQPNVRGEFSPASQAAEFLRRHGFKT